MNTQTAPAPPGETWNELCGLEAIAAIHDALKAVRAAQAVRKDVSGTGLKDSK